jgi:hypothetical protein
MRCYLMRKGHIEAVVFLTPGPDQALVEQGKATFARQAADAFDAFEVWDGTRKLYAHPEEADAAPAISSRS